MYELKVSVAVFGGRSSFRKKNNRKVNRREASPVKYPVYCGLRLCFCNYVPLCGKFNLWKSVQSVVKISGTGKDTNMKKRTAKIHRKTKETDVNISLNLNGTGKYEIDTGVGFLDHMLTHLSKHSKIDTTVKAKGDLDVDSHHTVEDIGLCLGECLDESWGTRKASTDTATARCRWRIRWRMCRLICRAGRAAFITWNTGRAR